MSGFVADDRRDVRYEDVGVMVCVVDGVVDIVLLMDC